MTPDVGRADSPAAGTDDAAPETVDYSAVELPEASGDDVLAFQYDSRTVDKDDFILISGGEEHTIDTDDEDGGDEDDRPERDARVGLFVSSTCRNLIREFLGYKEEHVGTSQATDHCLDALRYACMWPGGETGKASPTWGW